MNKREIKFRAWDNINNDIELNIQHLDSLNEYLHKEKYNVMQFTGLKDKNGFEIYEGDIVSIIFEDESDNENYINPSTVIWSQMSLRWDVPTFKDAEHGLPLNWTGYESLEIIGNIYQNPELI